MKSKTSDLEQLTEKVVRFRDKRNWKQFHNSKDLALALSIEAAELNELFLWKKPEDADRRRLAEELADVFVYALLLAHENRFNVSTIVNSKMKLNSKKYPVKKSKGTAKKYSEL